MLGRQISGTAQLEFQEEVSQFQHGFNRSGTNTRVHTICRVWKCPHNNQRPTHPSCGPPAFPQPILRCQTTKASEISWVRISSKFYFFHISQVATCVELNKNGSEQLVFTKVREALIISSNTCCRMSSICKSFPCASSSAFLHLLSNHKSHT